MRAIVQRVSRAEVRVEGAVKGQCGLGLAVLVGAGQEDTPEDAARLADRVAKLRIFNDPQGKMNLALGDLPESAPPGILVVSNFTLYGNAWKSRRPSFTKAAGYEEGERLYLRFVQALSETGLRVETGEYGASMEVELVNDGPVTLWLDTAERS